MNTNLSTLATVAAALLALAGALALIQGRMFLSGTLFMFTAFAIYVRETRK